MLLKKPIHSCEFEERYSKYENKYLMNTSFSALKTASNILRVANGLGNISDFFSGDKNS